PAPAEELSDATADFDPEVAAIFTEEAMELIELSEGALSDWRGEPASADYRSALKRPLHTLKGGARMAGITPMGDLRHELETLVMQVDNGSVPADEQVFEVIQARLDELARMREAVANGGRVAPARAMIARIQALSRPGVAAAMTREPEERMAERTALPAPGREPAAAETAQPLERAGSALPASQASAPTAEISESAPSAQPTAGDSAAETPAGPAWDSEIEAPTSADFAERADGFKGPQGSSPAALAAPSGTELPDTVVAPVSIEAFVELEQAESTSGSLASEILAGRYEEADEPTIAEEGEQSVAEQDEPSLAPQHEHDGAPEPEVAASDDSSPSSASTISVSVPLGRMSEPRAYDDSLLPPQAVPPGREPVVAAERQEMARVDADLLDQLLNISGEASIARSRLEQQLGSIDFNLGELSRTVTRLKEQLRSLEIETEAQILHRHEDESGHRGDFDPLELDRYSSIQQFSRALAETANDVASIQQLLENLAKDTQNLLQQQARTITELQNGLMRTRMVPFQRHVQRLARIVRQAASDTNKRAELVVEGAAGEL